MKKDNKAIIISPGSVRWNSLLLPQNDGRPAWVDVDTNKLTLVVYKRQQLASRLSDEPPKANKPCLSRRKQEALLSQRGRAMLRVCIASIQNVERSLLLIVVSASDIPLRTIKFFPVLFSSAYWSVLQAVTNRHSLLSRRLCDLHCMVVGNCFCHFVVCMSSNRSIASGAWPTVSYTQLCRRLMFLALHTSSNLR